MKLLKTLMRQVEETRFRDLKHWLHESRQAPYKNGASRQGGTTSKPNPAAAPVPQPPDPGRAESVSKFPPSKFPQICWASFERTTRSPIALAIAVISLTSVLGYRYYNTPKLDIGKAATQTIYAPASATIEDPKATEDNRKAARTGSMPVLMLDRNLNQQIQKQLEDQINQGNELHAAASPFPFIKTATLSLPVQTYLRKIPEAEWQKILNSVDPTLIQNNPSLGSNFLPSELPAVDSAADRQQAIAELQAYRRSVDLGTYLQLIQAINEARLRYSAAITLMSTPVSTSLPQSFNLALLDLTTEEWQKTSTQLPKIAARMLAQGLPPGLPTEHLTTAFEVNLQGTVPPRAEDVSLQLLSALLQPNLLRDEEQTRLQAERAAQEIVPVMVSIRRGDPIVRNGEVITSEDFALLDHFKLSRREVDWGGLLGFGMLVSGSVAVIWVIKRRYNPDLRRRDGLLLWLLSLSTPLMVLLRLPTTTLPAVGLLVGGFYGAPLGLTVTGLLTLLLGVSLDLKLSYLIPSAAAGLFCSWLGERLRSREELALLGVGAGLLQGGVYLILSVASGTVWYTLLGETAFQAILGLAWVVVGMGLSPYLEQLFDLITTIRLVELANPNRPLLKRLAAEAPGTFQHTLFVATLAEAAARALGCNVELVRTGTLYHDIGKMHDPLGFIENQMGGPNKHDQIDDPWQSVDIIRKHVTEGVVMARKARLPKAIQAFIPEHQGTMLIAYFYHQAQQRSQTPPPDTTEPADVPESAFRYAGPIPQSRETGIVMLADSCEAALRSLKDATPEEALAMINKILRARWQDNQLIESGLTRDEMTQIASIFVQVWQQSNHQRIAYPKLMPTVPASSTP